MTPPEPFWRPEKIQNQLVQTIMLGFASSALVILIAIPIGIAVTRRVYLDSRIFLSTHWVWLKHCQPMD